MTSKRYKTRKDLGTIRGITKKERSYWSTINRGKRGLKAVCCPSKSHYAKGQCKTCYYKTKWETDPVWRERQQTLSKEREKTRSPRKPVDKDTIRAKQDAKLYNLLPGERQKIWDHQDGIDPISGLPLVPMANLDHCHKTGKLRGLLNPMTNKFLVDDEKKLMAMLAYIQNPPAPIALGETVFGLLGRAQHKKKMRYGPDGSATPQVRKGAH